MEECNKSCWEVHKCGQEAICRAGKYKGFDNCWELVGSFSKKPECLLILNNQLDNCENCIYYKFKHKMDSAVDSMKHLLQDLKDLNSEED